MRGVLTHAEIRVRHGRAHVLGVAIAERRAALVAAMRVDAVQFPQLLDVLLVVETQRVRFVARFKFRVRTAPELSLEQPCDVTSFARLLSFRPQSLLET